MKINKLILTSLAAIGLVAGSLTSCDDNDLEQYDVNAPDWVQNKIDSIAALNVGSGDTTNVVVTAASVGSSDNTAAWWSEFSQGFEVPAGKVLHILFTNHSSGGANWNNWNLCVATNDKRTGDDYSEYFVIRSDRYGWGNGYDGALIDTDYGDDKVDAGCKGWADWLAVMNGAEVELMIDHSSNGATYVTALQTGNDGNLYTETFTCESTPTTTYSAFLICDGSSFDIHKAFLVSSTSGPVEDQEAVKIELSDTPEAFELDAINGAWKNIKIKVTYEDGTSAEVDTADVTFDVVPDTTTIGTKTVVVAYSKTKQGNYGKAVATSYQFEVTAAISSIKAVAAAEAYFYAPGTTEIKKEDLDVAALIKSVVGVTGTKDITIPEAEYKAEATTIPTTISDGEKIVITITYKEFTTTLEVPLKMLDVDDILFDGKIIGKGKFAEDETFKFVFENDNSAQRTSYLLMPEGTIPDCSESKAMSISFWVNGNGKAAMYAPIFSAYGAAPDNGTNTFPMFIIQGRGLLQTNCAGWIDFKDEQNVAGANTESIAYLEDNEWHLVTVTVTDTHAEFIVDKNVVNAWDYDGSDGKNATGFLTDGHSALKYICVGGNQAWEWGDNDSGYKYAKLKLYDKVLTADEIAERIANKE